MTALEELADEWDRDADAYANTARHTRDADASNREMARSQELRYCANRLRNVLGLPATPRRAGDPRPVPEPAPAPAPSVATVERLCARTGCGKAIPSYRTFCTPDWLHLPAAIRARLASARRELRAARRQAVRHFDPQAPDDTRPWLDDLAAASLSVARDKYGESFGSAS